MCERSPCGRLYLFYISSWICSCIEAVLLDRITKLYLWFSCVEGTTIAVHVVFRCDYQNMAWFRSLIIGMKNDNKASSVCYASFGTNTILQENNVLVEKHQYHLRIKQLYLFAKVCHGPLTSYAKLRVAHAPGMPGKFSSPPRVSNPVMHHGTCVSHVPWCMPGSLTSGFLWSRWRGKGSRHSRRMCNSQFCISGKRSMVATNAQLLLHCCLGAIIML